MCFSYNKAYRTCGALEEIVIPSGVTELPYACFRGCEELSRVVLPDTLEYIEEEAFAGCTSLEEIIIPCGCETEENAFEDITELIYR